MKQRIRLTEGDLHRIIRNCVNEAVKKDPMKQWFKDFDNTSKFRENMDYITKGGKEPNSHRKNVAKALGRKVNESTDIDPKQKERLAQLLLNKAGDIQSIIHSMIDYNGHSHNYLEEWIEGEEWFQQLKSATYDMILFAKDNLNETDYGTYEDDPIYC